MRQKLAELRTFRGSSGFLAGLATGLALGAIAMAHGDDAETGTGSARNTAILYAVGSLAIDTETNAGRIEELSERIDDLEIAVKALSQPKK